MPKRDGSGPIGRGPLSGRGMGFCRNAETYNGYGLGMRMGRGNGRCLFYKNNFENEKTLLEEQKSILEGHLKTVQERLNDIKE